MRSRSLEKWNKRIQRAGELAARYPFATEALRFYESIAGFQKSLYADLAAATPVATNVAPSAASGYANIALLGSYQVRAVPAGTAAANRAANVLVSVTPTTPATLGAGTGHTVIIADKAAGGAPSTAFVLTDR